MAWQTPKENWTVTYDAQGNYIGDYFNYGDYNRIVGNLAELKSRIETIYGPSGVTVPSTKSRGDYVGADDLNRIENCFLSLNMKSLNIDYGDIPRYVPNGPMMDYIELNRLEGAIGDLYGQLGNTSSGRRHLQFNLGMIGRNRELGDI